MRAALGSGNACFTCKVDARPLSATGCEISVDVGIASLITTSEGEQVVHPGWYRGAQRKLRVLQRRLARRRKGRTSRRKVVQVLQWQHERVANQRKDFLNRLAHRLIEHSRGRMRPSPGG